MIDIFIIILKNYVILFSITYGLSIIIRLGICILSIIILPNLRDLILGFFIKLYIVLLVILYKVLISFAFK